MKILIGDDHPLFREGVHRLLSNAHPDAEYFQAGTFEEMLECASRPTSLSLILSDLQMPGWPGFSGITQLRSLNPHALVVVISASEARSDVMQALENGAAGYIPKSSSPAIMLGAIDLILAGGVYVPPAALGPDTGASSITATELCPDGESPFPSGGLEGLTPRQREVLDRMREGKSNKLIAYELGLSEGTVKIHVTAIFKALGVRNRTQAVISASKLDQTAS